jgi:DNA-binding CsgD family transcriptional regulator
VVITGFKLFNQPAGIGGDSPLQKSISETKEIVLSYRQNIFSLEFAALDYKAPAQNQYKYKMEGLHNDWIYLGNRREIVFSGLEPGEYVFRVKGSNNDGIWNNEGTSLEIVITPPFWKTGWFRILVVLCLVGVFLVWHRARMKNLTLKLKTEAQLARVFEKYDISEREQEIIHLILKGRSNKEIEDALYISLHTVKNHIYSIFRKLGVKNRLELINFMQKSIKD